LKEINNNDFWKNQLTNFKILICAIYTTKFRTSDS